ncbi:MAG: hypothetical protein ACR2RB_08275 [Gammaproteobacteria bacterium]
MDQNIERPADDGFARPRELLYLHGGEGEHRVLHASPLATSVLAQMASSFDATTY